MRKNCFSCPKLGKMYFYIKAIKKHIYNTYFVDRLEGIKLMENTACKYGIKKITLKKYSNSQTCIVQEGIKIMYVQIFCEQIRMN